MKTPLLLSLPALLVLPSAASAATVTADIENRQGTRFGPVIFEGARGEENDVTVRQMTGRLIFTDTENTITATGDCNQLNNHTASCPVTEDIATVRLGNRSDFAQVTGLVEVLGGTGADRLSGSSGFDDLNGQAGDDVLRGKASGDELTGASGRDELFGGRGEDDLIDGERDRTATRDVFVGGATRDTVGPNRGDMVIYATRDVALRVNLGRGTGPDHDHLREVESVEGGSGDDRLKGARFNDNHLIGNGGDDVLRARADADFLSGGRGDDILKGARGDDVLNGGQGRDRLNGGLDDDDLVANDATAEVVNCRVGEDIARTERLDTLGDCELANSDPLYIEVQPEISRSTATFRVACQQLDGCDGTLSLNGPNGENFGSGDFTDLPDDPETFTDVAVELTAAAVEALADGATVQVAHGDTGGYRAFMRSG